MKIKKKKMDEVPNVKVTIKNLHEEIPKEFVPTGNVLLNLACSDRTKGGYGIGKMTNLIGDSSSGKTILALTMLADASRDPKFKDYDLIFDDVETALEIDIPKLCGSKLNDRLIIRSSNTIEDFYGHIMNRLESKTPFIMVLDSFDALTSREEQNRALEYAKQERDHEFKNMGSFKTEKQRMASEMFRVVTNGIRQNNSFLLIISQTRDNLGFGAMFSPKTRSGGKALKFYATHEIWLSVGKSHKKHDRTIGSDCMVKITKNKITGKRREVFFPIYYDYGVDSIESCINFLIAEKEWKKSGNKIVAEGFIEEAMTQDKLIQHIENNNLENKLFKLTGRIWHEIEDKIKLNRKPKYE